MNEVIPSQIQAHRLSAIKKRPKALELKDECYQKRVFRPLMSKVSSITKNTAKQTNDQLAMEPPRKVQSIAAQSPEPWKIMGMERLKE